MKGRAVVIGASIGGLFASAMLRSKGWEVDVYERVPVELSGRGAGIVTHKELVEALNVCGAGSKDLGVTSELRTGYDIDGNIVEQFEFPQVVTSWDRLHTLMRAIIPDSRHHLDHVFERYEELDDGIRVYFTNGHTVDADLLVAADGFRSNVRGQLFPDVQPAYSGYVVWRGVAPEEKLSEATAEESFKTFGFFLPEGDGEVIGYPIAGKNNDLRVGKRQYNWVWYRVVDDLDDMLTDEKGVKHDISIPPPLIRKDVIQNLRDDAAKKLPKMFNEILDNVPAPFFTPIYDHASPALSVGRVAMVGDAAFVARPHIGAGVTKAAQDALSLAERLHSADSLSKGLAAYNADRFSKDRIAYEHAQYLGEYLKPRYTNEEEKAEWAAHHNLQTIMRDTAVINFY